VGIEHGADQGVAAARVADEQAEVLDFVEVALVLPPQQGRKNGLGKLVRALFYRREGAWAGRRVCVHRWSRLSCARA
jgi:hypothetical protein